MSALFRARRLSGKPLNNVPTLVDFVSEPKEWKITQSEINGVPRFQWTNSEYKAAPRFADAYALRQAFLDVKTVPDALEFLAASGPFRTDSLEVSWPMFQEWQVYFRKQRLESQGYGAPPEHSDFEVLDRIVHRPVLTAEILNGTLGAQVHLLAKCRSVVEAVAATIWLDKVLKVTVLACLHCGRPFTQNTKRNFYCDHECSQAAGDKRRKNPSKG